MLATFPDLRFSFFVSMTFVAALILNSPELKLRAEVIREKGSDRSKFFRGEIGKYTRRDIGSSFLLSKLISAFLFAQLEAVKYITSERLKIWNKYHLLLTKLESQDLITRPTIPEGCKHNAHMYYVILPDHVDRQTILNYLSNGGINPVFHYAPLHDSPAGKALDRPHGNLLVTKNRSGRLIRLPLWVGLNESQQKFIVETLGAALESCTQKTKITYS